MPETVQGFVDDLSSREVNTRDGKPSRVYELRVGSRKYSTFKPEIITGCIIGEPVEIEFEEVSSTRDGQTYTNYRLLAARRPVGGPDSPPAATPAPAKASQPPVVSEAFRRPDVSVKDEQIMRQTACKLAADLLSGSEWTLQTRIAFQEIATLSYGFFVNGVFDPLQGGE